MQSRSRRIKRVLAGTGIVMALIFIGGVAGGVYESFTSIKLICNVEGEAKEIFLRDEQIVLGKTAFPCDVIEGERLCGPITRGSMPVYIYAPPSLERLYFALKPSGVKRETCHALGLGYAVRFNICVSLKNTLECSRERSF